MRRANGTGTVVKLSGNRRRPYAVKISGRDRYGHQIQTCISYHETARAAQTALDEYNQQRIDGIRPSINLCDTTLTQVYDLWSMRKFAKAGKSSVNSYEASWSRLSSLGHKKMSTITIDDLQAIIDQDEADGKSSSTINNDKSLMSALFDYAMERDIIVKDYSKYVKLPHVGAKFEKSALTEHQIAQLKKMAADGVSWADTALILCYTGFRITELLSMTRFAYDAKENCLRGGLKTEAGRNRAVPIHPVIEPYIKAWLAKGGDTIICNQRGGEIKSNYYRLHCFAPLMESIGAPGATPHWCRHTFATRLHSAGVGELYRKRLLGHSDRDITEHYTHTDITELATEIKKLA